jgi:signal transduction histidine kinase
MRRLVSERQTQDGLEITLEVRGEAERLPPDVAVQLYAIAQEALNNVAKHSGAAQAVVRLDLAGVRASLEVEDCGRGFEPHVAASRSGYGEAGYGEAGYGLSEMAGRAAEIGWDFQVESTPGHGTLIRLQERAA